MTNAEEPAVIVRLEQGNITFDDITGVETVTVSPGALVNAISQAIAVAEFGLTEPTVEIKAKTQRSGVAKAVDVIIPISDLEIVAQSQVENVKIASEIGEVTLNTAAINDLIASSAPDATEVEFVIERKDTTEEDLTAAQKIELRDEKVREIYDVSLYVEDKKLEDFKTNGKLTIGLPYALKASETSSGVWAFHVKDDGSKERMTEGRKYARGVANFITNHLSVYAVVYEPVNDEVPGLPGDSAGGGCDSGIAGFALIALALMAQAVVKMSGKK
jgi:hypothetical protein